PHGAPRAARARARGGRAAEVQPGRQRAGDGARPHHDGRADRPRHRRPLLLLDRRGRHRRGRPAQAGRHARDHPAPARPRGPVREVMHSQRARAIVIAGGRYDDPEGTEALTHALAGYMASGGSAALIGQPLPGVSTIAIANTAAVVDLARALHGLGYRRFGILGGPAGHLTARDRREGFARTVDELGESSAVTLETAFTRDGGYDGMARLLAQEPDVELVFAVNDVMAVGAMAAARDAGREVGRDIAVAEIGRASGRERAEGTVG